MATTTTNFGWDIPQSTDLVKDGATAIAALGQDIDTALVDLKGGTTGQILSKASGTDLDYTWITNDVGDITAVTAGTGISGGGTSGAVTVTNSMATAIDAKGDLIAGTGADAFSRLAVGTNGQALVADSTTATGLKWGSVSSGFNLISTTSFSGVASQSISSVFSATYTNYRILINISACTGTNTLNIRLRSGSTDNSTAGNYLFQNFQFGGITVGDPYAQGWSGSSATSFIAGSVVANSGYQNRWVVADILSPFETFKTGYTADAMSGNAGPYDYANKIMGRMDVTTAYDGFTIISGSGNITGKVSVYGYNI
jgi:hypothetical protein